MSDFKPISNTKVIPVNGNILVKVELQGVSAINLLGNSMPSYKKQIITVAGTSVETIPLNKEVIINNDAGKPINDPNNPKSLANIKKFYRELDDKGKREFRKNNRTVDSVDYMIVYSHDIMAIIDE